MIRTSMCKNTIFSKYFVLPMTTFPLNGLSWPRTNICFRDKKVVYQLTINPLWLTEFESVHFVWKTNGLPLTYSHL